jgi:hypothetical protein
VAFFVGLKESSFSRGREVTGTAFYLTGGLHLPKPLRPGLSESSIFFFQLRLQLISFSTCCLQVKHQIFDIQSKLGQRFLNKVKNSSAALD